MDGLFVGCFRDLEDPRVNRTKKHLLEDIIAIGLCAVVAGAEGWEEIEDFGHDHQAWLLGFLNLPNGIPSHDTIARVFSSLNPQCFQESCLKWFGEISKLEPETVIALDGKTIKASARKRQNLKGLHIVNAWSCANRMSLGQLKVEDKSNEITAVPELLKQLSIKGAIVTLDAMGCQESIVKEIRKQDADYVISLKGNQGALRETVKDSFILYDNGAKSLKVYEAEDEIDCSHGRIDERKIEVISTRQLTGFIDERWQDLHSIIRISSQRNENGKITKEQRFYISSLEADQPVKIMSAIRSHWQIENCLHWSLDVSFSEDNCRVRDENAAQNLSWMRKVALGLLKKDESFKASIKRKQKKANRCFDYLAKVITAN